MKKTDLMRKERELRRARKKEERLQRTGDKDSTKKIGDYINELHDLFFYNDDRIFNIKESVEILEFLENMKDSVDQSQWDNIIRKSVKKAGVKERDTAVKDLYELMKD